MKIDFTISNIGDGQVMFNHKFQTSNQQNIYQAVRAIQVCSNMCAKQSIIKRKTDRKKNYKSYKNSKEE